MVLQLHPKNWGGRVIGAIDAVLVEYAGSGNFQVLSATTSTWCVLHSRKEKIFSPRSSTRYPLYLVVRRVPLRYEYSTLLVYRLGASYSCIFLSV